MQLAFPERTRDVTERGQDLDDVTRTGATATAQLRIDHLNGRSLSGKLDKIDILGDHKLDILCLSET